ncbi:Dol-P-Man:Man(7)GlcNAc(2)-PP-Dol alpha-1,6-mannosyltransferase [Madurella fahalii]|uniref:Mannosyltransferase n=1 Tax=Madurella fahalii TaxID=1157608 RepID=A0ABQ0FZB0_9PEZI
MLNPMQRLAKIAEDAPRLIAFQLTDDYEDVALSLLIPGLILVHLIVAPYTKVEESFNIQAAHDVLVYGTPTSDIYRKLSSTYDHFTFPGAVPRTFIGAVLLAGFAQPAVAVVGFQHAQFVVRAVLGLFNAACLLVFAQNLRRAYGATTARWYLLLQASQFHVVFYASRTLPNMFAFGLTTLAFAFLLPHPSNPKSTPRRQRLAITMFVFAAAVFRSEVALLLAINILYLVILPELSLERVIFPFSVSFLTALATSVPIDSYFWQRPLWPELWGFYYNVVQGSASNWGVSPWHYYFTSALPRLLVNPLAYGVLIPFALRHPALRPAANRLVIPPLLFIAVYSLQPHKETRFIFYAVPPLTAAAALSANLLFNRRRGKGFLSSVLALVLVVSVLCSFAASSAMLALSALNYPGGEALAYVRDSVLRNQAPAAATVDSSAVVPVHADVLACMTGVTLFGSATASSVRDVAIAAVPLSLSGTGGNGGQEGGDLVKQRGGGPSIVVDKTEGETVLRTQEFWRQFGYVLVEEPERVQGMDGEWEKVAVVKGYGGIEIVKPGEKEEEDAMVPVVGMGRTVALWKRRVRALTGGWWIGPRMVEKIYILKRVKVAAKKMAAVEAR